MLVLSLDEHAWYMLYGMPSGRSLLQRELATSASAKSSVNPEKARRSPTEYHTILSQHKDFQLADNHFVLTIISYKYHATSSALSINCKVYMHILPTYILFLNKFLFHCLFVFGHLYC